MLTRSAKKDAFFEIEEALESWDWEGGDFPASKLWGLRPDPVRKRWNLRIRVPGGHLSSHQMRLIQSLAVAQEAAPQVRLTVRQDLEIHDLPTQGVAAALRKLDSAGLSCWDGGLGGIRNVVAGADSGLRRGDVFDVQPFAQAVADHYEGMEFPQGLPGRTKIGFSARPESDPETDTNDIAVYARIRGGEAGFEVRVGGSTGADPKAATRLAPFVPMLDLLPFMDSLLQTCIHLSRGMSAPVRIRRLVERFGPVWMASQVAAGYTPRNSAVPMSDTNHAESWTPQPIQDPELWNWRDRRCEAQCHAGFWCVSVEGDFGQADLGMLEAVADIADNWGQQMLRLTRDGSILVPWIREEHLARVYHRLGRPVEALPGMFSCPGPARCGQSEVRPRELLRQLRGQDWEGLGFLKIRVSGCRRGCGMHAAADIGFYGDGKEYLMCVGADPRGQGKLSRPVARVTPEDAVGVTRALTEWYLEERHEQESLGAFYSRMKGGTRMSDLLDGRPGGR